MAKTPTRPAAPKAEGAVRKYDFESVLTDEERKALREKAVAKVTARDKLDAEEAYLKAEMDRLEREKHPEILEEMREVRLNLAPYADRVILDGRTYFHGELYTVPKRVYDVMMDAQQATWRHDAEIKSGNENDAFYRRERNAQLNWKTGQVSAANGQPVRF